VADRPLVLLHGYSSDGTAFAAWRRELERAGWRSDQLITVSYESLTDEVSVRDIAEGFDVLLQQHAALADDAPFDVVVHSTGMLVLRAWLTRRGTRAARVARVKHLIALAPATFGSPLAHKGRSFLGALLKGRKSFGPDFLEAGDQVLDALELGSRFSWELAHADLFGSDVYYDHTPRTPYVFVFCGARGFHGLSAVANSPGSDGTVRWAGCALNSRKVVFDLTAEAADDARVQVAEWTQDDVPMHPIAGVDHGSILSAPPDALVQLVVRALGVGSRAAYTAWSAEAEVAVREARAALTPWQQFIVRAVDERGDGIADWNLQWYLADGAALHPFTQDVHVYRGDASYRCFHVNLAKLRDPALLSSQSQQLSAQLFASTGTTRVRYLAHYPLPTANDAHHDQSHRESTSSASGAWCSTLDVSSVLPGGAIRLFHPFTTTFMELRLDRDPLTGPGMVIRLDPS
jgi:hypothetical protein